MRAWNRNVTDYKKNIFAPDYSPIFSDMTVQKMSHDFVRGQSVAETNLFQPLGLIPVIVVYQRSADGQS